MQAVHLISDFADFNHTQRSSSVLTNQMFRDVARHLVLEHKEVFILLEDLRWILDKAISQFCTTVRANQIKVQCLTLLICQSVLEASWVLFKDSVNGLFTLRAERSPFATHQAYKAAVSNLDDMVTRDRRSRFFLFGIDLEGKPAQSILKELNSFVFDAIL